MGMELLPADVHRIVALFGDTFDVFKVVFPELLCDLHGIADLICDSHFRRAFLKISSNSKFSEAES